jgi:pilus assembly protein Flp/PilA
VLRGGAVTKVGLSINPDLPYRLGMITYLKRYFANRGKKMTRFTNLVLKLKVWKDTRGQDLIEYALMAGFVAVAAGAIMPGVASSISTIFSKISSVMTVAASQS